MTHNPPNTSPATDPLAHLTEALCDLERRGLRRRPPLPIDPNDVSFCSNDYLGIANRIAPSRIASGAGASRLIAGERIEHRELEAALASWLKVEACLLFTSGYAANLGAISSLVAAEDLIVSDALNHASIIDGARLSKARVVVFPHNDHQAVARILSDRRERRAWVVVESYFSMDADGPDLRALRRICDAHSAALMVDEAHALGVFGPVGRGLCAAASVTPDVLIGTLGKAFGAQGAFVAGRSVLHDWLWNRARSFVFSTGLAPILASAAKQSLDYIQTHPEELTRVASLAQDVRDRLTSLGFRTGGYGHVIPIHLSSVEEAVALSASLKERGIIIPPIRPPTVPTARLRLTVTARHTPQDIDRLVDAFTLTR